MLKSSVAAPRHGDGDASHIAMKSIRMHAGKSISQINSYVESNKNKLWSLQPGPARRATAGVNLLKRPGIFARFLTSKGTRFRARLSSGRSNFLGSLAHDEDLFTLLLTAYVKETSPAFLAKTNARLGWRVITAK